MLAVPSKIHMGRRTNKILALQDLRLNVASISLPPFTSHPPLGAYCLLDPEVSLSRPLKEVDNKIQRIHSEDRRNTCHSSSRATLRHSQLLP